MHDDDFSVLEESRHMFFGLKDPFGMIREETEAFLRKQVPDTELERIVARDRPKFLTMGTKSDDGKRMTVTYWGVCVRATLNVASDGGATREVLDSALTFLFGDITRGRPRVQTFFDVGDDAEAQFDDKAFKTRFLRFRVEDGQEAGQQADGD